MSFLSSSASALLRLGSLLLLVVVFVFGMASVVYMSLEGREVTVPEITGKNFTDSEHQLASLGLKIKKRADRVSNDVPGTIIEQLPKAGDTVKTGQMILVVTSSGAAPGEAPPALKKSDEDDTEKIEEMITDKPKKAKANSNTGKKKADTNRDTNDNPNSDSNSTSTSNSNESNSNKKGAGNSNSGDHTNKNSATPSNHQTPPTNRQNPVDSRTRSGETRPRVNPKPQ